MSARPPRTLDDRDDGLTSPELRAWVREAFADEPPPASQLRYADVVAARDRGRSASSSRAATLPWALAAGLVAMLGATALLTLRDRAAGGSDPAPAVVVRAAAEPTASSATERRDTARLASNAAPGAPLATTSALEASGERDHLVGAWPTIAMMEPPLDAADAGSDTRSPTIPLPVEVRAWSIEVAAGTYVIDTAGAAQVLHVTIAGRALEVAPDSNVVATADASGATLTVHAGGAAWIEPPPESSGGERETAAALALAAEAALLAGDGAQAVKTLERLVRRFPRARETRAALLDLARLREQQGEFGHALCAYALYRARFPASALTVEVERALARLGPSARGCTGLTPR